jgi:hypothetical protein
MPTDKARKLEYMKEYAKRPEVIERTRLMDRSEERKAYKRELYQKHKEHYVSVQKKYREKHGDKYNATKRGKYKTDDEKYKRIMERSWTAAGIKLTENTFEEYDKQTHCQHCNIEFCPRGGVAKTNKKSLDHCHLTGYPRNIICFKCNNYQKKIDNLKMKLMLDIHRYFKSKSK